MNKIIEEITTILQKTQGGLREYIKTQAPMGIVGDGYMVYAKNNTPKPMLCVHLDTINTHYYKGKIDINRDFEYDQALGVLGVNPKSSLSCLGGDDRAGVWIALAMIEYMEASGDYKYDVGFFDDEEVGCLGSSNYRNDNKVNPLNTTCYIGLDRRSAQGVQEVALYGDDNLDLLKLFEDLGYKPEMGSVTDASNLSGEVACINLSVGYDNEHTKSEVLYIYCMVDTLEKLKAVSIGNDDYLNDCDYFLANNAHDMYSTSGYGGDDWYFEELQEENDILREALGHLGADVDRILEEARYYTELGH